MKKIIFVIICICIIVGVMEKDEHESSSSKNVAAEYLTDTQYHYSDNEGYTMTASPRYSYAHNYDDYSYMKTTCGWCAGQGTIKCRVCKGTGENSIYDQLSPVLKGFEKPYCEGCDGNGYIICGRCNGSGME